MNKLTKLLSVFVIAGALGAGIAGVTGCKKGNGDGDGGHTHNYQWVDDKNGTTHHEHCDVSGCDLPDKESEAHVWGTDNVCDKCEAVKSETPGAVNVESVSLNLSKYTVKTGKTVTLSVTVLPANATDKTVKWSSSDDKVATVKDGVVTAVKAGTANITVTTNDGAKTATCAITVKDNIEYDIVATKCDLTALWNKFGNKNKLTEDFVFGKFTFSAGVYFDSTGDITGNTVNTQKKDLFFNLTGYDNENTIQFDAKSASTGANPTFALIDMATGEQVWSLQITTVTKGIKIENLPAGYYKFTSDTSARLGNISISEKLEKAAPAGISVKNPALKMLAGRELVTGDLEVYLDYDNGRQDSITDFTINDDGFDATKAGKQKVKVEYTPQGATQPFTADVEVTVYAIDSIELSDYSCNLGRITLPVQKIFKLGETFNSNNLAVTAICSAPDVDGTEKFILKQNLNEYTVSTPGNGTTGKQTVTVTTTNGKTGSYDVYFVDAATADKTKVIVDGSVENININSENVYTVKTVNQAIQMFKALEAEDAVEKVVTIKNGEYKEKVEIDLPNISLVGEGTDASKNVLWFDLIAGFKDPSGTTAYSTDGSASVSIRSTAAGFHAENLTFKNYWNTNALYVESTKLHGDTQAVALLVQADMATFNNCRFTSYHDTLYAMEGRHVFEDCYIEGRTDYIFGATATSYFKNCTINTLGAGDAKNGGYIVATKGSGVGGMKYGYVFNGCTLTGDANVVDGTVSLARGWDKGMTLAFINCNISKAYSTEYFGDTSSNKNDRYTQMNAAPNPAQLFEYNNTGAGALPQAVLDTADPTTHIIDKICTILTPEQAAVYDDLAVVFSADNGTVKYQKDWDGTKKVVAPPVRYEFGAENMGTSYEKKTSTDENGIDLFDGDMTIYALNGATFNTENAKNFLWLSDGCVIKFKVAGKVFFDPYGTPYGSAENINVNYINGMATVTIKTTENSPITSMGCCIKVITLDKTETPAHVHQYGDWNITAVPAADATGMAVRTCLDCEEDTPHQDSKELPELSVEKYNVTASETAGKLIYTLKSDETVTFEADAIAGVHAHNYGAWVITATLEAAGKATQTCTGTEGTCDAPTIEVDIPVLTSSEYTITNNTATLEQGGTGTYSITVDGKTITFDAPTAKLEIARWTESGKYQYSGSDDPVSTDKILFVGCGNSGGWVTFGKNGGYVALNLPEGAKLEITRSPYDNAEKIKINGVEQEGAKNTTVSYTVKVPGYVVISADNTAYFKVINITIDPDYQHTAHAWSDWTITPASATDVGSATRHCLVENCGLAGETQNKELPVLSQTDYTVAPGSAEGKSLYTLKSDTTISFEADTLAGMHVHQYGEWVVVAPTDTATGTATKTCTDDCPDEPIVVELPVLTDSAYVITNNTATLEAGGTGTYTYTDATHGVITFTAATPKWEPTLINKTTIIDVGAIDHVIEGKVEAYKGLIVDATAGKLRNNGGNVQVTAGTKLVLKVEEGAQISIAWYDANNPQYGADANAEINIVDGIATITIKTDASSGSSGIYIKSVTVTYELLTAASGYTYNWTNADSLAQGTPVDSPDHYLEFKGCKANSDWLAFGGNGSYIKLKVAAGSTVTFQASQWDNGISLNGVEATRDESNVITYVAEGEGDVEIILTSPGGSSYIKSIAVS